MPDVYANIADADPAIVEQLANTLEVRAAEPAQRALREAYFADIPFPSNARVVEIGCGTGPVARHLASLPNVSEVVGVDPSPDMLAQAHRLSEGIPSLTFEEADGRQLPYPKSVFDVAVAHTVLCHVPQPEDVLSEARRVLRPGGWLAIFDGDYSTVSVALGENDPLQTCAAKAVEFLVHDPWFVRRMPELIAEAGFDVKSFRAHGYAQTNEPTYLLLIVDRGADHMASQGLIGPELAEALKAEARQRASECRFFGQIAYVSVVAQRPP